MWWLSNSEKSLTLEKKRINVGDKDVGDDNDDDFYYIFTLQLVTTNSQYRPVFVLI